MRALRLLIKRLTGHRCYWEVGGWNPEFVHFYVHPSAFCKDAGDADLPVVNPYDTRKQRKPCWPLNFATLTVVLQT